MPSHRREVVVGEAGDRPLQAVLHLPTGREATHVALVVGPGAWSAAEPSPPLELIAATVDRGIAALELARPASAPRGFARAHAEGAVALAWLRAHAQPSGRVGAIGAGTGANLVAALACDPATRPDALVLMSGIYDIPLLLGGGTPVLDLAVVEEYLGTQFLRHAADPRVSPARAALAGFPATSLHAPGRPPWAEQTLALTDALARASVPVTCSVGGEETAAAELARGLDWLAAELDAPSPRIGAPDHPAARALAGTA